MSSICGDRLVRLREGVKAPRVLCLDTAYDETIAFFHDLRLRTLRKFRGAVAYPNGKRRGRIGWLRHFTDFSTIEHISAGAALILASEYDRLSRTTGVPPATVNLHLWKPSVKATLYQLGFFKLLRLQEAYSSVDGGLIIEPMVANSRTDLAVGVAAIKSLFSRIEGDRKLRIDLSSAITDAVENVVGHAYPPEMPARHLHVPFWWLLGAADPVERTLTLVIFDRGITIPGRLPRTWPLAQLSGLFASLFGLPFRADDPIYDGKAIHTAMRIGATSTGVAHRGKGLGKIRSIIGQCVDGRLRIVSRRGECVYDANGSETITSHDVSLLGTYVELRASFAREDHADA